MGKCVDKIFVLDRWFYYTKTVNGIAYYTSNKKNELNGITLEIDKDNKLVNVLEIKKKKCISKTVIRKTEEGYDYSYVQFNPELMQIDENDYVNLTVNQYATTKRGTLKSMEIEFVKNKKLNKLCYFEPTFLLNTRFNPGIFDINSSAYEYFRNLVMTFKQVESTFTQAIFDVKEEKEEKKSAEEILEIRKVRNLVIPKEIYIYDRSYTLVKDEVDRLYFLDDSCEVELSIDLNLEKSEVERMEFLEEEGKGKGKCLLQIYVDRKNDNRVTARFMNKKRSDVMVNEFTMKNVKFSGKVIFDEKGKIETEELSIVSKGQGSLDLNHHPIFTNEYTDVCGNTYRMRSSQLSMIKMKSVYAFNMLKFVDRTIFQEDEAPQKRLS